MVNLDEWLVKPPKYTTFRINKHKNFDTEPLKTFLTEQAKELDTAELPKFYFLRPDCLVLERWPNVNFKKFMDREVIVDAKCAAAVLRGANVFAPGVLGLTPNHKLDDEVAIYGDVAGQCRRGLKVPYTGIKLFLGTGFLKMLRHDLFDDGVRPSGIAVRTLLPTSRLPVVNESLYPTGVVLLQNLPSMICGWVVNAQPNECILDMCAAPGNKTTHLGEMSDNKAKIVALDKIQQKVNKIAMNCEKQGISCVKSYAFDSTKCCSDDGKGIEFGPPFLPNSFDKVLLDAPCSGTGERPQFNNTITPKMLESHKIMQRKLMSAAVQVLRVGGKLIYSTCSVTTEENEGIVQWALEKFPNLKLIPALPLMGGPGLAGSGLTDEKRLMVQRFGPEEDMLRPVDQIYRECIGFFIAKFTKE